MAKPKTKQIYMNESLTGLEADVKERGGSFSARLDEIVERYQILLTLEEVPDFSDEEVYILSECVCGSYINCRKVRGLHLDVLDAATGTREERDALSRKVAEMGAGARLALIERLGQ